MQKMVQTWKSLPLSISEHDVINLTKAGSADQLNHVAEPSRFLFSIYNFHLIIFVAS